MSLRHNTRQPPHRDACALRVCGSCHRDACALRVCGGLGFVFICLLGDALASAFRVGRFLSRWCVFLLLTAERGVGEAALDVLDRVVDEDGVDGRRVDDDEAVGVDHAEGEREERGKEQPGKRGPMMRTHGPLLAISRRSSRCLTHFAELYHYIMFFF